MVLSDQDHMRLREPPGAQGQRQRAGARAAQHVCQTVRDDEKQLERIGKRLDELQGTIEETQKELAELMTSFTF